MNPTLIVVCQPDMDLQALVQAIEIAALQQGHLVHELPPPMGTESARSFALMPDDLGVLLKKLHPKVTLLRRPS